MKDMPEKVISNGKSRLNLRLPEKLDLWIKKYAVKNNTTVTQLVISYFTDLQKDNEDEVE